MIGSFVVPLAVVILFFELNTPKNVSVYQVGKLLLLGGALSLILTSVLAEDPSGRGSGRPRARDAHGRPRRDRERRSRC